MSGLFSRPQGDAGAGNTGGPYAVPQRVMDAIQLDPSAPPGPPGPAPGEAAPDFDTLLKRAGPLLAPDGDTTTDAPEKSFLGSAADMLQKGGQQQADLADAQGRVAAAYTDAERAAAQTAALAGPVMPAAPAPGGPLKVMAGHAATGELAAFAAMPGRR